MVAHVKEGCGIWNTARLLKIAKGTGTLRIPRFFARIKRIALTLKPMRTIAAGGCYEVDELHTLVGSKQSDCYVSYALCRETKAVAGFVTESRTKVNLERLTSKLLDMEPKRVFTDGLNVYPSLIPSDIHRVGKWQTLRIERKNLTLRVNLKRLARQTICFSRLIAMLEVCLAIWFWG